MLQFCWPLGESTTQQASQKDDWKIDIHCQQWLLNCLLFLTYVYEILCVYHVFRWPQRPEEGVKYYEAGSMGDCEPTSPFPLPIVWVLGIKLGFYGRAENVHK